MFVVWKTSYCIGDAKIDDQHRTLVSIINRLHEQVMSKQSTKIVDQTLMELIRYTEIHFRDEEELMKRIQFPQFQKHQKEHERLVLEIFKFKEKFDCGLVSEIDLFDFLKNWLINHILNDDLEIKKFIRTRF